MNLLAELIALREAFKAPKLQHTGYNDGQEWSGGTDVQHNGKIYSFTGKAGKGMKDGAPGFEYAADKHDIIWVDAKGKVLESMNEAYVVKSKDGVEKRFKRYDDQADRWSKGVSRSGQVKQDRDADREANKNSKDATLGLLWSMLNGPWEWTQLDWSDIMSHQVIPALKKRYKADPSHYSLELKRALDAYDDGAHEKLYKLFDRAIRDQKQGSSLSGWARQMSSHTSNK